MTDLVKRATRRADELTAAEYRAGLDRVENLVQWLAPAAVCFIGLAGYRTAANDAGCGRATTQTARWPTRLPHAKHQRPQRPQPTRRSHRPPPPAPVQLAETEAP